MTNPWISRRVLSYAHQGGALEAPSSTLFAIERAIKLGVSGIELDVHATADRHLVVCHDPTVDRTCNASGEIASLTWDELSVLDNAYYFVPDVGAVTGAPADAYPYRGRVGSDHRFSVARLEEVLELCSEVVINLDIKRGAPQVEPYEDLLASALDRGGRRDAVIVTSFNDHTTATFSRAAPEIATAPGVNEITAFVQAVRSKTLVDPAISRHVAIQVPSHFGSERLVDEAFVEACHAFGLAVHVWTVDERVEMAELVAIGVDGLMSDRPSVLVSELDRLGVGYWWR